MPPGLSLPTVVKHSLEFGQLIQSIERCHIRKIEGLKFIDDILILNSFEQRNLSIIHVVFFRLFLGSFVLYIYIYMMNLVRNVIIRQFVCNFSCTVKHNLGNSRKSGHLNTVASVCAAGDNLTKEDYVISVFFYRYTIVVNA